MRDHSHPNNMRVAFTNTGDWKVVKYNFFKMTMGPQSLSFEQCERPPCETLDHITI